jgi:hypothetical protein
MVRACSGQLQEVQADTTAPAGRDRQGEEQSCRRKVVGLDALARGAGLDELLHCCWEARPPHQFMVDMSLTSCLFRRRYSAKGTVVKKISLISKSLIHLINDIFWNLGFKNETQAEKVIVIIRIILIT